MVMPFAAEPKTSDGLPYLPQLAFNTVKSPFMSTNDCPKGLHSTLFVVRVVAYVSIVCHQTRIVKALIPIDVAEAINVKEKLCSQYTKSTHMLTRKLIFLLMIKTDYSITIDLNL
jgi:hypothetical protein